MKQNVPEVFCCVQASQCISSFILKELPAYALYLRLAFSWTRTTKDPLHCAAAHPEEVRVFPHPPILTQYSETMVIKWHTSAFQPGKYNRCVYIKMEMQAVPSCPGEFYDLHSLWIIKCSNYMQLNWTPKTSSL